MNKNEDALLQKIAVLERKVNRQKQARYSAEQQLEDISLQIYNANKSLTKSLADSEKRARDLAFLHEISNQIVSDQSLEMMILNTLPILCAFTDADYALRVELLSGAITTNCDQEIYCNNHGWIEQPELLKSLLPKLQTLMHKSGEWQSTVFSISEKNLFNSIHISFPTTKHAHLAIVLIRTKRFADEQKMFVLSTAKAQMLTGITRRINDARLKRYTHKLEAVLSSLKTTQDQLIQSEKMASLGQLAAGVAHEINNPLGYVQSNLQVLNDYVEEINQFHNDIQTKASTDSLNAEVVKKALDKADFTFLCEDARKIITTNLDGIQRVTEIVKTLKNFSHVGDEAFEPVSLFEVISSSLKVVGNQLKYQHKVENKVSPDLPSISGSFNQLQQVFINFFVNAAQAMPDGGKLTIKASKQSDYIDVYIIDNGVGMDEQTKHKVFTPFFTTKPVGEGTGLGMSVSYAILEKHKVEIAIESSIGIGTSFQLRFKELC